MNEQADQIFVVKRAFGRITRGLVVAASDKVVRLAAPLIEQGDLVPASEDQIALAMKVHTLTETDLPEQNSEPAAEPPAEDDPETEKEDLNDA